jgi:hypothetical protein
MIPVNYVAFIGTVHDVEVVVVNYTLLLRQRREVRNNPGCPAESALCRIELSLYHPQSL